MLELFPLLISFFLSVQCYTVCDRGKYGEHCNLTCPQNCALLPPLYLQYCDPDTGKCSEGCRRGWHGDLCKQDCNQNCLKRTCNHQTGHCTLGCSGTNIGHFCNATHECGRGWYGAVCEQHCSRNCLEEKCNGTTGVCILGCNGTYSGEFCNIAKVVKNEAEANILAAILVSVVGVAAITVTVFTIILFITWRKGMKRKRRRRKDVEEKVKGMRQEILQQKEESHQNLLTTI